MKPYELGKPDKKDALKHGGYMTQCAKGHCGATTRLKTPKPWLCPKHGDGNA